ncbi:hypothetical protein SAMN05216436_11115 [bacterium A37T11]|nr:hypothetical protein SAMN05216436_11115 [bacterium A37T11]
MFQSVGGANVALMAGQGVTGTNHSRTNGPAFEASMLGVLGMSYNPYTGTWYVAEGDNSGTKVRIIRSADIP